MRRRLLGTFLWCLLLPIAGLGRLLWAGLRLTAARVQRVLILGGLAVALSMPNPLTAELSPEAAAPLVRPLLPGVLAVAGVVLLSLGLRASWMRRLRRSLRRRGWFLAFAP